MVIPKLRTLFNPKNIAVIGATDTKGRVGYSIVKNLLQGGFKDNLYPINPKRATVQGLRCYPDIASVGQPVDLAIIATPAATLPDIITACGRAGVKTAIIVAAGFKELGEKGQALFDDIAKLADRYNLTILGPNCLGYIRPVKKLNASFAGRTALPGSIAFISQSGALCTAVLDWSLREHVGFSHFVSIGEMMNVGFHDLIDYFANDEETQSILLYMESITDARKFLSAARSAARIKPVIVLKAGRTAQGSQAAKSHTGSLTGSDAVFDAVFRRAGIIRVNTIGELFDCAEHLAMQKKPVGNRLAVITNAGGPGVVATDMLIGLGGALAQLSQQTIKALDSELPAAWSHGNPVDILGDADPRRYRRAVELCLADEGVDGALVILTPQAVTDPVRTAQELIAVSGPEHKPVLASWMGEFEVSEGRDILEKGRIPVYRIPENAVRSFMNLFRYASNLELLYETPGTIPHAFAPDTQAARKLINNAIKQRCFFLNEQESKKLLSYYGIPIPKSFLALSAEEAGICAEKIGFPVVIKILSHTILHKSEVGGYRLNVVSKEQAQQAFEELVRSVGQENMEGVLVEEMVAKRYELLIGCKKDLLFGPTVVFGMGGVAVEVFKDICIGLPPLNMALAMRIIEGTKIYTLLKGFRNKPAVDIAAIQFLLYKFAYLIMDFPEIEEIDINPFAVDETGGVVLDAKVVLNKDLAGKKIEPYSHLVISPYPVELTRRFCMKNGLEVTLRAIRPEDEPMEAEMFRNFSEETQRFRFFAPIKEISHQMLVRYTQIDYARELAIIAEIEDGGKKKMAGVARIISEPYGENAEFAIVVADPWQNQGLGGEMTDYVLAIARTRGYRKIFAYMLEDNSRMLAMLRQRDFKVTSKDGNFFAELNLAGKPAAGRAGKATLKPVLPKKP